MKVAILRGHYYPYIGGAELFAQRLAEYLVKRGFPLMFGRNIVCDRYVYDTIVDLAVDLNYSPNKVKGLLSMLISFLPKPDITFLVDLPEEIAYQRKSDIPSIDYLRQRRQIYLELGKEYGMVLLDGSRDVEELEPLIQSRVSALFQFGQTA